MQAIKPASHPNIPVIYCLRGIAASMVCLYHFLDSTFVPQAVKEISRYGSTGILVFFVISGVVIPLSMIRGGYSYDNWGKFMLKRLVRLEPAYLASLLLAIIYFKVRLVAPTSAAVDLMPGTKDLILHIGYLVPFFDGNWALSVYWTLTVEFQYYIFLSLLLPFVLTGKAISRYFFYGLFLILPFFFKNDDLFPFYGPIFLLGIAYTFMFSGLINSRECLIVVSLCLASGLINMKISFTIAAFITLLIIHFVPLFTNRVLKFLGDISYSIYLLHLITGKALFNLLSHKFKEPYMLPVMVFIAFLFTVLCSYYFYKLIEKPSQKLSAKIRYRKSESLNTRPVF